MIYFLYAYLGLSLALGFFICSLLFLAWRRDPLKAPKPSALALPLVKRLPYEIWLTVDPSGPVK